MKLRIGFLSLSVSSVLSLAACGPADDAASETQGGDETESESVSASATNGESTTTTTSDTTTSAGSDSTTAGSDSDPTSDSTTAAGSTGTDTDGGDTDGGDTDGGDTDGGDTDGGSTGATTGGAAATCADIDNEMDCNAEADCQWFGAGEFGACQDTSGGGDMCDGLSEPVCNAAPNCTYDAETMTCSAN